MASEKKPSIYYDRGTIGSSGELDEYGVWVKIEPQDMSVAGGASAGVSVESQDAAELSLPDLDVEDSSLSTGDFSLGEDFPIGEDAEGSTGSLNEGEHEDSLTLPPEDPAETVEGFTEISIEDFMGVDTPPESAGAVKTEYQDDATPVHTSAALTDKEEAASRASPTDLSTQILIKIADELASIRNELSALKNELSAIRPGFHTEGGEHGFFDKEADEKIALTGDELDNILNTADFTEEAGADAIEAAPDTTDPDLGGAAAELDLGGDSAEVEEKIPMEAAPDSNEGGEPAGELSIEDLTLEDIADFEEVSLDDNESEESGEPEAPISIDLDLEEPAGRSGEESPGTDTNSAFDAEEELELSIPEDALITEEELPEPELPVELPPAEGEPLIPPEEKNFAQVIPEGFIVEDEDTPAPDDDGLETGIPAFGEPDAGLEPADDEKITLGDEVEAALDDEVEPILDDEVEAALDDEVEPILDDEVEAALDDEVEPILDDEEITFGNEIEPILDDEVETTLDDEVEPVLDDRTEAALDDEELTLDDEVEPILDDGLQTIDANPVTELADETEDLPLEEEVLADLATGTPDKASPDAGDIPAPFKQELKTVLSYMDQLLESLPEDKIEEFAKSEYFDTYKKLFKELGIV